MSRSLRLSVSQLQFHAPKPLLEFHNLVLYYRIIMMCYRSQRLDSKSESFEEPTSFPPEIGYQ